MSAVEQILSHVKELPSMPQTVIKLAKMLEDDRSSAGDIERIIKPDPALTTNLLRLANSPYFGLPRKVESVRHAVTLMGTKRIFEVVAGAAFSRTIPAVIPGYSMDAKRFWIHSVAVGVLSESLAKELGIFTPDYTFTAGLLHDIGKLVLGAYLATKRVKERPNLHVEEGFFIDKEREVFGTDHGELGAILAERWDLPTRIVWAAKFHHVPDDLPEGIDQTLVDLVHAGNGLAHALGYGGDVGEMSRGVKDSVIARLGIKVSRLERVASETQIQIMEIGKIIGESGGGGR